MNSILQKNKCCYLCDTIRNLELHHIFNKFSKEKSEKYGFLIWLCAEHHRGSKLSPHQNRRIDLNFRETAQEYYEEHIGTREDFIKEFGRSYL